MGGFFFVWVLRHFGFRATLATLSAAGTRAWALFLFYPFMALWDTASYRYCFPRALSKHLRFREIYGIRLAGEALNNVTPFIDIGGEPLKVHLLHRRLGLPVSTAASATVVARTSILLSEALFLVTGVVLSFRLLPLHPEHRAALVVSLAVVCAAFFAVLWAQQKEWLKRLNLEISHYYATERASFVRAVFFNSMGWMFGGVEMYLFCRLIDVDISMIQAVMLESLLQLVRTASFFIPGNLGVQEGGLAFFMAQLGHGPVLGVGLSLLKRCRQLVWTAAGFVLWGVYRYQEAKRGEAPYRRLEFFRKH